MIKNGYEAAAEPTNKNRCCDINFLDYLLTLIDHYWYGWANSYSLYFIYLNFRIHNTKILNLSISLIIKIRIRIKKQLIIVISFNVKNKFFIFT